MSTVLPPNVIATGDSAVGDPLRFSLVAPSDNWIVEALIGMLYDYSQVSTWYKVGTATPDEAAQIFAAIWDTFGVDMATTGVIVPYAGGILPSGWIPCDGRSLVRADFVPLFNAIGTVWGAVDGDHFNVPDLRGRTLLGQGLASSGTTFNLGDTGGEETHTLTGGEVPAHAHSESTALPNATTVGPGAPQPTAVPGAGVTGSSGGGGAHNNMQPWAAVNYAIIS